MMDINEHQQIWSISFFIKKQDQEGISVNEQLAEELHKPGTKKFKRRRVFARFKNNVWAADLAKM